MALPLDKSRWATTGAVITDPSAGQRDTGWTFQQNPPSGVFNSWMNNVYLHIQYLRTITTEILTWTGAQTFNAQITVNNPSGGGVGSNFLGLNGATSRPGTIYSQGSNYTGAGTGSQHDPHILALGGSGGTASGQTAISAVGGASTTGNGGRGLEAIGGAGVFGGDGLIATGGASSSASLQGGNALVGVGGANTTSGKGGFGAVTTGADGSVQSGVGAVHTSGDLTNDLPGTVLRAGTYTIQGNVYTSGAKSTRSIADVAEAAHEIETGLQQSGADVYPNTGIRVKSRTGSNVAAMEHNTYGADFDSGFLLRQRPLDTGVYPAGSYVAQPYGVLSPWGILGAACVIENNSGTLTFVSGSDRYNVSSLSYPSAFLIRVTFTNTFLGANTYFSSLQITNGGGPATGSVISVTTKAATYFEFQLYDTQASTALNFSTSVFRIDVLVFGR